jgi:hypothetical protein
MGKISFAQGLVKGNASPERVFVCCGRTMVAVQMFGKTLKNINIY